MSNLFKTRNLYKLIIIIFLMVSMIKIKNQLETLQLYNHEIATLNEKMTTLQNQENNTTSNSKEDNEDIARKNLKMYYPNETPYKGY